MIFNPFSFMGKRKLKIAITGGIGSGKSVVANLFENHGYKVLSADRIAKKLLSTDSNLKQKIISEFGEESYSDGNLNKDYLASKVFSGKEATEKINSIVHPETIKIIEKECLDELENKKLVFVESALIFEAKREKLFDYILTVVADPEKRIEWVMQRDKIDKNKVLERLNNQIDDEKKISMSDFVLHNNSTLEELQIKSEFFLRIFEGFVSG